MVVGSAVVVEAGAGQPIRRVVDRSSAALVLAILRDEDAPFQRMVVGGEAEPERIAVAPGHGLDLLAADLGPQNGPRAHAGLGGALECLHDGARPRHAVVRVPAAHVALTGVEEALAEGDVLARDLVLVASGPVVMTGDAGVRRRALRPVDIATPDLHLLGGMVAGGEPCDEGDDLPAFQVHHNDPRRVVAQARRSASALVRVGSLRWT